MSHPQPLVPARPATAAEIPRSAVLLMDAATATGYTCSAAYAHGTGIDRHGDPTQLIESVVVRLGRYPIFAVASWWDGKFHGAYVWTGFTSPRTIGARELKKFVKA